MFSLPLPWRPVPGLHQLSPTAAGCLPELLPRIPFSIRPAGLYQFFTNFSSTVENVSGPVAIIAAGAEVARSNSAGLFQFAALVNINLAVVNILPLPALDGAWGENGWA